MDAAATARSRPGPRGRAVPAAREADCSARSEAMTLVNSTLVENLAGGGGSGGQGGAGGSGGAAAVFAGASTIVNATIAHNAVGPGGAGTPGQAARGLGGGIYVVSAATSEDSRLENTIVAFKHGRAVRRQRSGGHHGGRPQPHLRGSDVPRNVRQPEAGKPQRQRRPDRDAGARAGQPSHQPGAEEGRALPGHRSAWRQATRARGVRHRGVRGWHSRRSRSWSRATAARTSTARVSARDSAVAKAGSSVRSRNAKRPCEPGTRSTPARWAPSHSASSPSTKRATDP